MAAPKIAPPACSSSRRFNVMPASLSFQSLVRRQFSAMATSLRGAERRSNPDGDAALDCFASLAMTLAPIDRRRLGEEAAQDVVDQRVILLLKAGVRDTGHHGKMLVGIG